MLLLLLLPLLAFGSLFLLSKCFFLAPYRIGWTMYLANVVYETLIIKVRLKRSFLDGFFFLITLFLAWGLWGPALALGLAMVMTLVWAWALLVELRWLAVVPARQHQAYLHEVPLPLPRVIPIVRGPILKRGKHSYALGDWPLGHEAEFSLFILNPTVVRPQLPMSIQIKSTSGNLVLTKRDSDHSVSEITQTSSCPEPGNLLTLVFSLKAEKVGKGDSIHICITHGDQVLTKRLVVRSVFLLEEDPIVSAEITRWPYGAEGAFIWRGDHDLYDPCTFQSEEGLRRALGVAALYRMPTSIMMSARLSLVEEEHREFCEHHGWDRRSGEIPSFIDFMKREVDMSLECEFPIPDGKPYAAEVGNHYYLHYATHAAADSGNQWTSRTRMGEGLYPWMTGEVGDTFAEQRDNAVKGSDVLEEHLGVRPASFTIPGDAIDAQTARAVDAAGIEVGTETDANKLQKLLFFPAEHHPKGCDRLVELTRVLPRDPQTAPQIAMLKFWVAFARRNRRAMVYLAHHHMVMYEGQACLNLTSELLRYILDDMEGAIHSATLTSLGRYWRDVLCVETRSVKVDVREHAVQVANQSGKAWKGIPVVCLTARNRSWCVLKDLESEKEPVSPVGESFP